MSASPLRMAKPHNRPNRRIRADDSFFARPAWKISQMTCQLMTITYHIILKSASVRVENEPPILPSLDDIGVFAKLSFDQLIQEGLLLGLEVLFEETYIRLIRFDRRDERRAHRDHCWPPSRRSDTCRTWHSCFARISHPFLALI